MSAGRQADTMSRCQCTDPGAAAAVVRSNRGPHDVEAEFVTAAATSQAKCGHRLQSPGRQPMGGSRATAGQNRRSSSVFNNPFELKWSNRYADCGRTLCKFLQPGRKCLLPRAWREQPDVGREQTRRLQHVIVRVVYTSVRTTKPLEVATTAEHRKPPACLAGSRVPRKAGL